MKNDRQHLQTCVTAAALIGRCMQTRAASSSSHADVASVVSVLNAESFKLVYASVDDGL
jgi:hypothetical protein